MHICRVRLLWVIMRRYSFPTKHRNLGARVTIPTRTKNNFPWCIWNSEYEDYFSYCEVSFETLVLVIGDEIYQLFATVFMSTFLAKTYKRLESQWCKHVASIFCFYTQSNIGVNFLRYHKFKTKRHMRTICRFPAQQLERSTYAANPDQWSEGG